MRIKATGHGREGHDPPEDCACEVCDTVALLGRKWTLDVIGVLEREGTIRFNALERELDGISPRTLSDRLSTLESEGVVERIEHAQTPPKVEYTLEPKGQALVEALEPLMMWSSEWDR